MKPNYGRGRGGSGVPQQRTHGDKRGQRRGSESGFGAAQPNAIRLTKAQQDEAKAARDAVIKTMTKSSPQAAKKFVEAISLDVDVELARQLLLPSKGLAGLPSSLHVLCRQLRKLDISGNDLTDLSPLATLECLSNLNVAHNKRLVSLAGLSGTCLSVLNISYCAVESLAGLEHTALTLRTFIANDNQLQFQSPVFRREGSASKDEDSEVNKRGKEEKQPAPQLMDADTAKKHLPESLRGATAAAASNTVALRNYAIFASFAQCETVVLSRNSRLAHGFPTWQAEELTEQCGAVPGRKKRTAVEDVSDEDAASKDAGRSSTSKGAKGSVAPPLSLEEADDDYDESSPEVQAYKQRRQALALAHPCSVFERLPRLKKLSLSGCELYSLPCRWFLPLVTELRLAQNHLTSLQPDGVILRSLHILDISNNFFKSVATLRRCRYLEQLNVRGNPLLEEGAAQDAASGYVRADATEDGEGKHTEEGDASPGNASAAALVPISVQQSVSRLFPAVKLLDGQPLLTAEEMRAAYRRGRDAADAADVAAASAEEVREEAKQTPKANAEGEHETEGTAHASPSRVNTAKKTGSPARKTARVDRDTIAAEAEEKDVVVEAPASVVKTAHAPIVRRERVLLRPGQAAAVETGGSSANSSKGKDGSAQKKGPIKAATATVYGQAAVAQLLHQSRKTSAW